MRLQRASGAPIRVERRGTPSLSDDGGVVRRALAANHRGRNHAKRSSEGLHITQTCLVAQADRISQPPPRGDEPPPGHVLRKYPAAQRMNCVKLFGQRRYGRSLRLGDRGAQPLHRLGQQSQMNRHRVEVNLVVKFQNQATVPMRTLTRPPSHRKSA
jgi:hypothetical protein